MFRATESAGILKRYHQYKISLILVVVTVVKNEWRNFF